MPVRCLIFAWLALAVPAPAAADQAATAPDIRGGWQAETYTLKSGERHQVQGLIVFTDGDWSVTFFVTPDGRTPRRASAEGGTYTLEGTRLVLTHQYNFSTGEAVPGLPASPLRMTLNARDSAPLEPCTVTVEGDRLTLAFPSGNAMSFRRSSRP